MAGKGATRETGRQDNKKYKRGEKRRKDSSEACGKAERYELAGTGKERMREQQAR